MSGCYTYMEKTDGPPRYGIEGIAQTYEDPFGVAKINIDLDGFVADARKEVEVLLTAWQTQGPGSGGMFRPRLGEIPKSDSNSIHYTDLPDGNGHNSARSQIKVVVNDSTESSQKTSESDRLRTRNIVSPGTTPEGTTSGYFAV